MKRLSQEQLANMSRIISKTVRERTNAILKETGQGTELDERISAIASVCAAEAASLTLAYLYEFDQEGGALHTSSSDNLMH